MEGDGDLMKMLMHADPPDENIQAAIEETGMVQSGAYPQTGMAYGSGHYAGMQQQLPTISTQRPQQQQQQQQQRNSGFHSMNPGQMIPRSPNNGMMQPDMDLVLQQQYQQPQQSAYGNGNYQGYNGGYQGPGPVSPQTHSQTMSPFQAGFPSEPGYPSGTGGSQTMGEFGPQAGPNQTMGMPGPASLSLAAMSNRQQYYSEGYGMNPPVSPLHKQMPQGGGFLQPSGMPYSQQQAQSYQSSSYPTRPPSSPVQTQMQGFSSGGSSYTPRSSAGMQLPNMPYQSSTNPYQPPRSPTNPYQPPRSPGRRSSTSPVPQQDTGMYSRPHEPYPQPRSPFGASQVHFQQQPPQQQQHSSCMFVQPSTTPPQSHYQSQQLTAGAKAGGLTQRRTSNPGQQNTVKMLQSPPLKRSPPAKIPSPNPKSPDLARAGQVGFEERVSMKPSTTKETASSPPCSDPSQGISETTAVVSSSVQCSFKKKTTTSKKMSEGHKGVPHQRRCASSAESPSVSPPTVKKECMDGNRSKAEEMSGKQEESFKNNEGLVKTENDERKSKDPNGSNEISKVEVSSYSSKGQEGNKEERSLQSLSDTKGKESCGGVGEERRQSEVNRTQPDKTSAVETTSKAPQTIVNTEEERKASKGTTGTGSNAKMSIKDSDKTKTSPREKMECNEDNMLSSKGSKIVKEGKDLSSRKNIVCKGDEITSVMEHKSGNKEDKPTNPAKSVDDTSETSGETGKADDKTSSTACETGKTGDSSGKSDIQSEKNVSKTGKNSQPIDEGDDKSGKESGKSGKTGNETDPGVPGEAVVSVDNTNTVGEDKKRNDNKTVKIQTTAKEAKGPEEPKESVSKGNASSDEHEAINKIDEYKGINEIAKEKPPSQEAAKSQKKKDNTVVPSLRCDERLSSDDDDRLLDKTSRNAESGSAPIIERVTIESRTLGIQTTQQTTATTRTTQQQAAPIKATIIAKGKSSQNNQQVMVAKTTTGQMYLIQGNILVPVQKISSKDDASKQNPQLIVVKTAPGQHGEHKQAATAAKGDDGKEASKERKDGKAQAGNSKRDKTSKVSDKERAAVASSSGYKKSGQIVKKSERSPNTKTGVKSDKSPSKMSPTQPEDGSNTAVHEKQSNKTESPRGKHSPESKTPEKQQETSAPSQATPEKLTRGRPAGSKDKQKRKSYVHKAKRTQDAMEVEAENEQELEAQRKFSKTAIAVQEMSSPSAEAVTTVKRPLEVPTVSAKRPTKKRKISTSGSPVKHISTRPRGGIDGDSWVCSLCGKQSGCNLLGDLYGPYKTKFSKEKSADSSSKEGKLSQKLSSPGRKSSSSSDVQVDSESCDVNLWIHRDCGVWSPGVFMLGRTIHGLEQAVESAAQHNCTKCSELGATLACFKRGCNKMFHYACARDSGCSFIEDNFTIFCSTHK